MDFKNLVQLVTQRAREVLYDQRETARRALLNEHGKFLPPIHRFETAEEQSVVNTLERNGKAQITRADVSSKTWT